tara:strand:+ start:436 stop:957 length:522 start_codon:yes stop_codon:yes gene_type:complete
MNTLEKFEKEHLKELQSEKNIPEFSSGDTIKVHLKVKEGEKERIQVFEGVCISKKNSGINSAFTVRKISYGEGIERVLPLYSPQISKIEVVKTGSVRRSKLYYLRERSGKSARIAEKNILSKNEDKSLNKNEKPTDPKIVNTKEENTATNNSNENKTKPMTDTKNLEKNDEKK